MRVRHGVRAEGSHHDSDEPAEPGYDAPLSWDEPHHVLVFAGSEPWRPGRPSAAFRRLIEVGRRPIAPTWGEKQLPTGSPIPGADVAMHAVPRPLPSSRGPRLRRPSKALIINVFCPRRPGRIQALTKTAIISAEYGPSPDVVVHLNSSQAPNPMSAANTLAEVGR